MSVKRISVVIPAFNEGRLIEKCLKSIVNQTSPVYEIIVVDNNSTDDTVIKAKRFPNVTVIVEKRQGIGYARSAGFNSASGDIIARVDADTIVHPDWAKTIEQIFSEKSNIDAVSGLVRIVELSPRNKFWFGWIFAWFRKWHERDLGIGPILYGSNCAIRNSAWQKIKGDITLDDPRVNEDIDTTINLVKRGLRISYEPKLIAKLYGIRSLSYKKIVQYYHNDNYTLQLLGYGNPKRRKKAA